MKIAFIWHCVYPWDVRLEKMMKACAEQGHEIVLVCKGKHDLPKRQTLGWLRAHRVWINSRLPRALQRALVYPLFFNPIWLLATWKVLREEAVDLIVVRDLPLALMAGLLGLTLHKPVIMDMAENYPAALMAYKNPLYKPFLFGHAWLPRQLEKISLKTLAHVLVVTEEQAERLRRMGIEPARISLVGNTPENAFYAHNGDSGKSTKNGKTDLLFVGKLDAHRGIDLAIRALAELTTEFPELSLVLIGDGSQKNKLGDLARSLHVADKVELPGWIDFQQIPDHIRRSSVCLIPHLRSEHTDTTLPNKLFDYMAFAKPVVASDCRPIERVIKETDCGITFKSGDAGDLVLALRHVLNDPARVKKGQNGKRAVEQKYNWDVDKNMLMAAIQHVGTTS
jgi:glycosyltransferase involved in cell wall biosynthesis